MATTQAQLREPGGDRPQTIIARVPVDLAERLRAYATANKLSINASVVEALKHFFLLS